MLSLEYKPEKISSVKTSLYIPTLMPDEIWHGYFGRFLMVNSIKNNKVANHHLNEIVTQLTPNLINAPTPLKLALISRTNIENFMQHHTLMPLLRTTNPKYFKPNTELEVIRSLAGKLLKNGAFFCQDCVVEDINYYGIAFWRRSHQMIGIDWCNRHNSTLCSIEVDNAMHNSPDFYLHKNNFTLCEVAQTVRENIYVRNFSELIHYFSNSNHTFDYKAIAQVLSKKAMEQNLRICKIGRRKTISDVLIEELPPTWRKVHFPQLIKSNAEQYLYEFDGVIASNNGGKIVNILLLAAFLFKNTIKNAICELTQHIFITKSIKRQLISEKELVNSYINNKGNHIKVFKETKGGAGGLRCRLISLGCPPLGDIDIKTSNGLIAFYEGASLSDVLKREGVNIEAFSKAIRMGSPKVIKALKRY